MRKLSRRDVLRGSTALAASSAFASVTSAAPPASAVTPQLIEAARKEGKVVWYTSVDLPFAERIARSFEARYPGIAVRVERTGAERVFQRIEIEREPRAEHARPQHADGILHEPHARIADRSDDAILQILQPPDVVEHRPRRHVEASPASADAVTTTVREPGSG